MECSETTYAGTIGQFTTKNRLVEDLRKITRDLQSQRRNKPFWALNMLAVPSIPEPEVPGIRFTLMTMDNSCSETKSRKINPSSVLQSPPCSRVQTYISLRANGSESFPAPQGPTALGQD